MNSPFVEAVYSAFPSLLSVQDDTSSRPQEPLSQAELTTSNGWSLVYKHGIGAIPTTTEIVKEDRSLSFRAVIAFPKGMLDLYRPPQSPGMHPKHVSLRIGQCHIDELSESTMKGRSLGHRGLRGNLLCYANTDSDDEYERLSVYSINNSLIVGRLLGLARDGDAWSLLETLEWTIEVRGDKRQTLTFPTPIEIYGIDEDSIPPQHKENGIPVSFLRLVHAESSKVSASVAAVGAAMLNHAGQQQPGSVRRVHKQQLQATHLSKRPQLRQSSPLISVVTAS